MNRHSFVSWRSLIGLILPLIVAIILPGAISAQTPAEQGETRRPLAPDTASYVVIDTNQTKCYGATTEIACPAVGAASYGQDAQHIGHPSSYTNHSDGTVTDNVTGLMWQRSPDLDNNGTISATDKLSYAAAITYCDNSTQAGYTD